MDAISSNLESITGYPRGLHPSFPGLAYFLNGSLSVRYSDDIFTEEFPGARVAEVEGAGHYLHIDKG